MTNPYSVSELLSWQPQNLSGAATEWVRSNTRIAAKPAVLAEGQRDAEGGTEAVP